MATEAQSEEGSYENQQEQVMGRYLSPDEEARLLANEYGDEDAYYKYLSQITKTLFGYSVLSDILPWVSEDGEGTIIIRKSPYTARTTRGIKKLVLSIFDRAEFLQNLSQPSDQRKANLWVDILFNRFILEADRMDTEKQEFWGLLETIKRHAWVIRTRAIGYDRERILQGRRISEFIQKLGAFPSPPTEPQSPISRILGR